MKRQKKTLINECKKEKGSENVLIQAPTTNYILPEKRKDARGLKYTFYCSLSTVCQTFLKRERIFISDYASQKFSTNLT